MKYCLLLLFSLLSLSSFGQKYKLKKNVLSKDKVEVAKMEGKVNILKTDLTIKTMDDKPLVIVSDGHFSTKVPDVAPILWLRFYLPQLGKEIILQQKNSYFNTKQFLKYEFEKKGVHFYADGLHEDELELLEDYSTQLQADTLEVLSFLQFFKENLPAQQVDRPASQPVTFGTFNNSSDVAIIQGKDGNGKPIVIGKIRYTHVPGMTSTDPPSKHAIRIYKRFPDKVLFNGEETDYLLAGYIDLLESIPELFLYQNGREESHIDYKIDTQKKGLDSAKGAARYMVSKGLL